MVKTKKSSADKKKSFGRGKDSAQKSGRKGKAASSKAECKKLNLSVKVSAEGGKPKPSFKVVIDVNGPTSGNKTAKIGSSTKFRKLEPGDYKVNAKPEGENGAYSEAEEATLTLGSKDGKVELELKKRTITKVLPDKARKQFVNLAASDKDPSLGRKVSIEAHIEPKLKDVTVHFAIEENKRNAKALPSRMQSSGLDSSMQASLSAASAATDEHGVARTTLTLSTFGGDRFKVLASLHKDPKAKHAAAVKSQEITVWRRLWYQVTQHKDLTPPGMGKAQMQLEDVFIDFVAEPVVTHTLAPAGQVIVGRHNAAAYHALHANLHPGQSVHIILCDQQIDAKPGLTNEVEKAFTQASDFIQATKGGTFVMHDPPLNGDKLFKRGTWTDPASGKSGRLTDDPKAADDDTGLVAFHDQNFVKVDLPKNAKPGPQRPIRVRLRVTVASGPWGGDGGTAPHNLIVIDKDQIIHTMCVLHELGHLMNMGPLASQVHCPPGFRYTDHPKIYSSNGAHCYSGGRLTAGEGDGGTCIMYHQLNTNCSLKFCRLCAPFVKAMQLKRFMDLEK